MGTGNNLDRSRLKIDDTIPLAPDVQPIEKGIDPIFLFVYLSRDRRDAEGTGEGNEDAEGTEEGNEEKRFSGAWYTANWDKGRKAYHLSMDEVKVDSGSVKVHMVPKGDLNAESQGAKVLGVPAGHKIFTWAKGNEKPIES